MRLSRNLTVLPLLAAAACSTSPQAPDAQLVAQWMRSSLAFVRSERLGPPVASRISAYAAVTLYEGYASDPSSRLRSLAGQLNGLAALPKIEQRVDGATVAAEAERVVLDSLFRDGFASTRRTIDSLSSAQSDARAAAGVSRAVREASQRHGRALGAAILAWAAKDGFYEQLRKPWIPPTGRDTWVNTATADQYIPIMLSGETDLIRPTNPNVSMELERAGERFVFTNRPKAAVPTTLPVFNPVKPTAPYWGDVRPFVMANGDECAPPPPPAYSEAPGSPFWKMGREFYDSVSNLTPDKIQTALFWADNPAATGTPGFHWVSVLNQMVARRKLRADEAVETYALMTMGIADAFIGCWKEKYRSNVVRPVTYVQRVFDKSYATVFPTPPFPEYTSGHSVQSSAAVLVLERFLGDTISFIDSTQVDIGHPPRAFPSFRAARDEVAVSRLYGGVHYMPSIMNGLKQGTCVGERIIKLKTRSTT